MSESVNPDVNERPVGHAPGHARHDRLLVVRLAAGDVDGTDREQAQAQVDQCADCARLAADTAALRSSIAALPAPRRTRNFQLTPEQAEQLSGSTFDRLLRRLAMPKLGFVRPLAGVAFALGLTIMVVGAGLPSSYLPAAGVAAPPPAPVQQDTAASPPARDSSGQQGPEMLASAPGSTAGGADQYPTSTLLPAAAPTGTAKTSRDTYAALSASPTIGDDTAVVAPEATATAQHGTVVPTAAADSGDKTGALLIYGGLTLAMIGFAILLLSIYARRRTEDPLLR